MRLLIVIVNYRTADLTLGSLESLASEVGPLDARVVVVDGASGDGSAERLDAEIKSRGWWSWVSLMPLTRNGGFAFGNNAAIRPALLESHPPEYILLLNPDTVVQPGALAAMTAFMQTRPLVGIVGCRLRNADGSSQRSAFRFPTILGEIEQSVRLGLVTSLLSRWVIAPPEAEEACRVDWVSGACMLVRAKVFQRLGLLDDGYFMYFEETDFCIRARRERWECWYVPQASVVHLVGQASGGKRLPAYVFESRRRYFVKNHGRVYAAAADFAWTCGHVIWKIQRAVRGLPDVDPPKTLTDFLRHSVFATGFGIERAGR